LAWAHEVWLPVNMEYMALQGVKQVLDNLKIVREELDHDVSISYVIPTFVDARNSKTAAVLKALRESFGRKVTHGIRTSVRLSEAPSYHQSIFDYAPRSSGAEDFSTLTRRILEDE
jgi:chromosome partitioning protein